MKNVFCHPIWADEQRRFTPFDGDVQVDQIGDGTTEYGRWIGRGTIASILISDYATYYRMTQSFGDGVGDGRYYGYCS